MVLLNFFRKAGDSIGAPHTGNGLDMKWKFELATNTEADERLGCDGPRSWLQFLVDGISAKHFFSVQVPILFVVAMTALISCIGSRTEQVNEKKVIAFTHKLIDSLVVHDPWAKMFGDIDGDGLVDIIIGGRVGPLVWYRNPDWTSYEISSGGYDTVDGEAGDVDGDGDIDIIMGGLFWYENPGELANIPGRSWTEHFISEHPTHDIELADLNDDGWLDIITRNQSEFNTKRGNTIHLWINLSEHKWEEIVLECDHGEGLRVDDLDGDGDVDIVATGFWFEHAGPDDWRRHEITQWHPSANLAIADFNGDQLMDVVLTPSELAGQFHRLSWFEQPSASDGGWDEHILVDSIECVIHGVQVADFNNDGSMDIAYAEMHQGEDPDEVAVLINQGVGEHWQKMVISERGSHSIEVVDINMDGFPDVFGANWSGDYQPVELWLTSVHDQLHSQQ